MFRSKLRPGKPELILAAENPKCVLAWFSRALSAASRTGTFFGVFWRFPARH
jgi:hypothetical protein